jgi:hypothetical protein
MAAAELQGVQGTPLDESLDMGLDDGLLEDGGLDDGLLGDSALTDSILDAAASPDGLSDETWNAEMGSDSLLDTSMTTETSETEESESGESSGVSESFEDAFAALKEEIESNPEGERIDDVLKMEALQESVAKIDFNIPQHEHALARGMPIYAVPDAIVGQVATEVASSHHSMASVANADREEDSVESMRRIAEGAPAKSPAMAAQSTATRTTQTTVTTETAEFRTTTQRTSASEAAESMRLEMRLDASGSLLDEATKARLSQVLDEIISVSVRKAVREEMPRLMERMTKTPGAPA